MSALNLTMVSPLATYLDEMSDSKLALRPASLDGKVLGLLPNWRPSAIHILRSLGDLLQERYKLKEVIMEQPVRELPLRDGKLLDTMKERLDSLVERCDVVITASGDWGSCTTWCSHVTPALEERGVPAVMVVTDMFSKFARRMSSTQGFPYIVIAETPNPIRQLEAEALRPRAEAMIQTVIDGLTLPPAELQARMQELIKQIHPKGVARSTVPV